jgi:hypothetical protein
MSHRALAFPYFLPIAVRLLTEQEQAVVTRLTQSLASEYRAQIPGLKVVGRCGCALCPTVFFEPASRSEPETVLVSYAGNDQTGGCVAVVLLQKSGRISQLEFYSVAGHDPWFVPAVDALERFA